jgi:hypothetical protein
MKAIVYIKQTLTWLYSYTVCIQSNLDFMQKVFYSFSHTCNRLNLEIRVITKLLNSEQSYKGKVKTHKYINRQNQSTTRKL